MSRFFLVVGDVRKQGRWVVTVAASASALHLFSVAGPAGDQLSDLVQRLILSYNAVLSEVWRILGYIININLVIYRDQLTFSILMISPFILRFRILKRNFITEDDNKILSTLNFICISVISTAVSLDKSVYVIEEWRIWVSILPFAIIFFVYMYM